LAFVRFGHLPVTQRFFFFLPGELILVLLEALGVVCGDSLHYVAQRIFMDVLSFFAQLSLPHAMSLKGAFRLLDGHESALRRHTPARNIGGAASETVGSINDAGG
jgi:hypothetical protein